MFVLFAALLLSGAVTGKCENTGDGIRCLRVRSALAAEAFPRVGQTVPVEVVVKNKGTNIVHDVSVTLGTMPDGVEAVDIGAFSKGPMFGGDIATFTMSVKPKREGRHVVPVFLNAGGDKLSIDVPVDVLPSLGLEKAEYVPEPKPVESDYDIAALCFPGWNTHRSWDCVRNVCPERKPVLGWYDEKNPEVIDWQIKWLVENGIKTLYVDWYWDRGRMWQEHWLKTFVRTRCRKYIKWAMMWANHNPKGSHSDADMRAVTEYWIKNYFCMPEYLKKNGKPIVLIWDPWKLEKDTGVGGAMRLLGISREMAKAAGYSGIEFVALPRPEAVCTPEIIGRMRDFGFDMTAGYRFMAHKKGITDAKDYKKRPSRYPFKALADAMPEHWQRLHDIGILPFMPNISTGWDDRPWRHSLVIYDKSVADFRRICEEAKKFADRTGNKRICVGPLNEWAEGSYAEPNMEFGFGFYESVRDVFCKKPKDGWPLNYGPKDVGLGPYDMMPPLPGEPEVWSCDTNNAPGVVQSFGKRKMKAEKYDKIVVRVRTKAAGGDLRLSWAKPKAEFNEDASLCKEIVPDGEWHDYVFPVNEHKEWTGLFERIRIDPVCKDGTDVEFAELRLCPRTSP